jgi:hypothetical protein
MGRMKLSVLDAAKKPLKKANVSICPSNIFIIALNRFSYDPPTSPFLLFLKRKIFALAVRAKGNFSCMGWQTTSAKK